MANTAAHLVDRVLPDVPVRQFVLSLPFELRRLAAFKPAVLTAFSRIFVDTVFAAYRARAKRDGTQRVECGALTFVQRFGGSLNLNLHFHSVFLDGVFTRDEQGRALFHPAPPPDATELHAIARRVHDRSIAWLRRHGHFDEGSGVIAESRAKNSSGVITRCLARPARAYFTRRAMRPSGRRRRLPCAIAGRRPYLQRRSRPRARRLQPPRRCPHRGGRRHAANRTLAGRPSSALPPSSPPRFPLLRYSGVLAPNSPWRKDVVPKPREKVPCLPAGHAEKKKPAANLASGAKPAPHESARAPQSAPTTAWSANAPRNPGPVREPSTSTPAVRKTAGPLAPLLLAPGILSVAHWDRLLGGLLYAASPRLNWPLLLQRTFAVDVLECPKCQGRMRVIAAIHEPAVASAILDCLGITDEVPSFARARDPTDDDGLLACADAN